MDTTPGPDDTPEVPPFFFNPDDIDAARRAADTGDSIANLTRFLTAYHAAAEHPNTLVKYQEAYLAVHTDGPAPSARNPGDAHDFPLPHRVRAILDADTAYATPREIDTVERQARGIIRNLARLVRDPAELLTTLAADADAERPEMRRARRAEWTDQLRTHRNEGVAHAEQEAAVAANDNVTAHAKLTGRRTAWNEATAKGTVEKLADAERRLVVTRTAFTAAHNAYVDAAGTPHPDYPKAAEKDTDQ